MKVMINTVLLASLVFLSACGYHLRGSIALPAEMKSMYLFGVSSGLSTELQAMLRASDGKVAVAPDQAGIVIKVMKEDMRRRALSIGKTGKSSEVELTYYLRFQFYDNKDTALLDEQTIDLSREFFNDQTAVLAKENEELLIRKEMYRQAARMIMTRAQIALEGRNKP
jgi:LPS-assembly lipoprotein